MADITPRQLSPVLHEAPIELPTDGRPSALPSDELSTQAMRWLARAQRDGGLAAHTQFRWSCGSLHGNRVACTADETDATMWFATANALYARKITDDGAAADAGDELKLIGPSRAAWLADGASHASEIQDVVADGDARSATVRVGSADASGVGVVRWIRETGVSCATLCDEASRGLFPHGWAGLCLGAEPGAVALAGFWSRRLCLFDGERLVRAIALSQQATALRQAAAVLAVCEFNQVALYDVRAKTACVARAQPGSGMLLALAIGGGGDVLYAGGEDRDVCGLDVRKLKERLCSAAVTKCAVGSIHPPAGAAADERSLAVRGVDCELAFNDAWLGAGARARLVASGLLPAGLSGRARRLYVNSRWLGLAAVPGSDRLAGLSQLGTALLVDASAMRAHDALLLARLDEAKAAARGAHARAPKRRAADAADTGGADADGRPPAKRPAA